MEVTYRYAYIWYTFGFAIKHFIVVLASFFVLPLQLELQVHTAIDVEVLISFFIAEECVNKK